MTRAALLALLLTGCIDPPTSPLLPGEERGHFVGEPIVEKIGPEYLPDRAALTAFYEQANGPNWAVRDGWLVDSIPLTEWAGVSMVYDSIVGQLRVERLVMDPANNLKGLIGIPKVLGELASLRVLDLRNARWGAGGALPTRQQPDGWVQYRPTAVPREFMRLPLDSLRLGFDGHCLSASDSVLIAWGDSTGEHPAR